MTSLHRDPAQWRLHWSRRSLLLGAALGLALGLARVDSAAAFQDKAIMGTADASVTIIEYASMTCPHCARFHADAMPTLKKRSMSISARCGSSIATSPSMGSP